MAIALASRAKPIAGLKIFQADQRIFLGSEDF